MGMWGYWCYGLCLHSDIPLPELARVEQAPDVTIRLGHLPDKPQYNGTFRCFGDEEEYCLVGDVGDFLVRYGREIIVEPLPGVEEALLRHYLLGLIMSLLLRQRGLFMLHASAVALHGHAVAFFGASGSGKSTIAAAFAAREYTVLSDDYAAITICSGRCQIFPGVSRLRLYRESALLLGATVAGQPPFMFEGQKGSYVMPQDALPVAFPLIRLYGVREGSDVRLEAVGPQTAFLELTAHTQVMRPLKVTPVVQARHFTQCTQLANAVPVRRLLRPRALDRLCELVRLVERDLVGDE